MKKKKLSKQTLDAIYKVLDSVFSILVLPLAFYGLFTGSDSELINRLYCAGFFSAFLFSCVFQALRNKNNSTSYKWQLVQAGIYLVSVILIFVTPSADICFPIITVLFAGMLVMGRVVSISKKRTYRNIFFNVSCIILIIAVAIWGAIDAVALFMLALDLGHIVSLSFSGVDMKIMTKVIRKTYAADVLSGLLLFVAAFSFIFPVVETDNITSFRDALWYCFAVVTTIGFGDYSATSTLGRIMTVILGAYGIVVVALITSVVVNFYSEVKTLPEEEEDEGEEE